MACLIFLVPCVAAAPPPGLSTNPLPPSFYGFNPGYYGPYLPGHFQYGNVNPSVYSNSAYPTLPNYGMSSGVPLLNSAPSYSSPPAGTSTLGNLPATPYYGYGVRNFMPPTVDVLRGANTQVVAEVHLPTPDAQLWVEGRKTTHTGTWRWFLSPPLVPGDHYVYDFRASWYENGREVIQNRHVPVRAGQGIVVDFTRPAKNETAPGAKSS
jgi:uncharacterized protein (TIGR03000 family)